MSDDEAVSVEHRPPEEVFGLLSNDLRVEIVQVLGKNGEPLSFLDLRTAVSERDSGKFNYHLQKLVGHFVTQDEDGYRLSFAGEQVYGAILSGSYTANASIPPFEFDGPCPMCSHSGLIAEYGNETALLYCRECEAWRNEFSFPPGTLGQFARQELPFAFDRWMRATVMKFLQGFCENCGGRVDAALERASSANSRPVRAVFECERCDDELRASPALPVLYHPVTISFFEQHGVNVLHDPSWRYYDEDDDMAIEMINDDPSSVRVSVTLDEMELVATVDHDVTITDVAIRSSD
ncbi:hypothetical protein ACFQO4_01150 [Saliphagus sp. GCM10025334]